MEIGAAVVEFMGEVVAVNVIFGDDNVEPTLWASPHWSRSASRSTPATNG
jgi:hypothetical protein